MSDLFAQQPVAPLAEALRPKTLDEVVGQSHLLLLPPELHAEYGRFWQGVLKGEIHSGEFRRVMHDGGTLWIHATYMPITDEAGALLGVIKLAHDITSEVLAKQRVEQQSQFQAFGQSANHQLMGARQQCLQFVITERVGRGHADPVRARQIRSWTDARTVAIAEKQVGIHFESQAIMAVVGGTKNRRLVTEAAAPRWIKM